MINDKKPGITLQFPKLNNALMKDVNDLAHDDPRRGIIVLSQHAIVINKDFCLAVDLWDYFSLDCAIDDENELAELKKILFYMNGKVFQPEYWLELVKGATMQMHNGLLYIESPKYAKDLHYKELDINLHEPLKKLTEVSKMADVLLSVISLPMAAIDKINNTMKSLFKHDHIIFEFHGQDSPVKFTFANRKHVFGFIVPDYNSAQDGFKFEYLRNFVKDEIVRDTLEESKPVVAPPPPQLGGDEVEQLEGQESLFGGDIYEE